MYGRYFSQRSNVQKDAFPSGSLTRTAKIKKLNISTSIIIFNFPKSCNRTIMEAAAQTVRHLVTSSQPAQYAGQDSFFGGAPPLSEGIGYLVVLGFGAAFSIFTTILVYIEGKYSGGGAMSSEKFK